MITTNFVILSDWGTGFTGNISITNNSTTSIKNWVLQFEANFNITELWQGELVTRQGNKYDIKRPSWDLDIEPGTTVTIGFNAQYTGGIIIPPTNYLVNGIAITPGINLPSLSITDATIIEGNSGTKTVALEVVLSAVSAQTVTVKYDPINATATLGSDYQLTGGTLSFAPGETKKTVNVSIVGDTVVEANETFKVKLSTPSNATIGKSEGLVTITNDDQTLPPPTNGNMAIDFKVDNQWNSGFTATISLTNKSQTTINGWNLEFDAPFSITSIWNAQQNSNISGNYKLSNVGWNGVIASNATVSFGFNGSWNGSIVPEPTNYKFNGGILATFPSLSITDITTFEGNSGTKTVALEVALSTASTQTVTVKYDTINGTAISGSDYQLTGGTLNFAPGEVKKTINVTIVGDTLVEANESFNVKLSAPSNATISKSEGVITITNDDIATPVPTTFKYGEALQKSFLFYEAQRSGDLPSNNRIEWRGDSALNDGNDVGVNLTGGYYDAGDTVKFGLPMASSMTLLSWGVVEYRQAYESSGQLDEVLEAVKWGTDYLLKAHVKDQNGTKEFWGQVGNGDVDHSYWGAPETMTMQRPAYKIDRTHPGSDLAGESAASLAAASIIFKPTDANYANTLLQNAKELFAFADTYRGKYSDSITDAANYYRSWDGYPDELVWAATWLYKATGDTTYLHKAESYYWAASFSSSWTQSWGDKLYGSAVLLAQITKKSKYRTDVESWLNYWSDRTGGGITYTSGGLAWLAQWGSLRYSANTAFLAGIYSDTVTDYNQRYANFAKSQVDYILGDNPRNSSYVVGFGNNSPVNPHHRAAHGGTWNDYNSSLPNDNILYGALVGGPASVNDFDYQDVRTDYIRNEVALDYNAGLTGALARMYANFGGAPLTDAQLDALPGIVVNN